MGMSSVDVTFRLMGLTEFDLCDKVLFSMLQDMEPQILVHREVVFNLDATDFHVHGECSDLAKKFYEHLAKRYPVNPAPSSWYDTNIITNTPNSLKELVEIANRTVNEWSDWKTFNPYRSAPKGKLGGGL